MVDVRSAANGDTVVDGVAGGNLDDYVHPLTDEILTRISWTSPSFSAGTFDWSINLDQAVWMID